MKLLLRFDPKITSEPIIAKSVIKTKTLINILKASVDQRGGEMLIEIPEENSEKVISTLKEFGVDVTKLDRPIIRDDNLCVHCGLCISLSPTEVFKFDEEYRVTIDEKLCLHCYTCVVFCPVKALKAP